MPLERHTYRVVLRRPAAGLADGDRRDLIAFVEAENQQDAQAEAENLITTLEKGFSIVALELRNGQNART